MIEPKEIEIRDKKYIISKLPATVGREILFKYPTSNIPKIGDYNVSQEIMLKLLSYTAVVLPDGTQLELKTQTLVDNHVPNAEMLILLEKEMFLYNFSFFSDGIRETGHTERFRNLDDLIGTIISSGKATLNELRTVYSLEDAFLIWEADIVPKYNEYRAMEESRKKK